MSLVSPDEPDGDTWSFSLPAGDNSRVVRKLKKADYETPGVKYQMKISA